MFPLPLLQLPSLRPRQLSNLLLQVALGGPRLTLHLELPPRAPRILEELIDALPLPEQLFHT